MALPRRNRLNLRFNRLTLNKEGVTHRTPLFTFIVSPNSTSYSRYAVILSRKFSPLAVNRNRIKRIITNTLRLNIDKLPSSQDTLIIPQKRFSLFPQTSFPQNFSNNFIKLNQRMKLKTLPRKIANFFFFSTKRPSPLSFTTLLLIFLLPTLLAASPPLVLSILEPLLKNMVSFEEVLLA